MSEEWKSCPMCGDSLEIVHRNGSKYVRCIACIFETARHGDYISDDELKRRCNRRPAEDALKAEVERIKAKLHKLWYLCRERRRRPYITPIEYNFLIGLEWRLESLFATDTNVLTNAATPEKGEEVGR